MYLSRLVLDERSRRAQRCLADCQEMHRMVMAAFPRADATGTPARAAFGVLYRLEEPRGAGSPFLIVLSSVAPEWGRLADGVLLATTDTDNPAVKPIGSLIEAVTPGMRLRFRLRANVTKKVNSKSGAPGARLNGQRVEVRGEPVQLEWLRRHAAHSGFELLAVRVAPEIPSVRVAREPKVLGHREQGGERRRLTFGSVLFEGLLRVTDAEVFRQALANGIGPAKAYGFGLLSVAPHREVT